MSWSNFYPFVFFCCQHIDDDDDGDDDDDSDDDGDDDDSDDDDNNDGYDVGDDPRPPWLFLAFSDSLFFMI